MNKDTDLHWVHERSALVGIMLLENDNPIFCEVTNEDSNFVDCENLTTALITSIEHRVNPSRYVLIDTDNNEWLAARPAVFNNICYAV